MPFVAILYILLREVEGHTFFSDRWGATPQSGVTGRFDWWRPRCQFMFSMFWSSVGSVVAGAVVCHVFVSRLRVPQEPVLPTESPPGTQGGAAILVTGGCAE